MLFFWTCVYDYDESSWGDSDSISHEVRRIGSGVAATLEDAERYIDLFRHDDEPLEDSLWGYIKELRGKKFRTVMTIDADGSHHTIDGYWYHIEEEEGCLMWEEVQL